MRTGRGQLAAAWGSGRPACLDKAGHVAIGVLDSGDQLPAAGILDRFRQVPHVEQLGQHLARRTGHARRRGWRDSTTAAISAAP